MELFGINLTAGRETFVAGDVVSGEIIIQTHKDEHIQELVISISGEAHVKWKKCFTKYQETESYFNVKKTLIDMTSSTEERHLSRGMPWVRYFELDVPEGAFPTNFKSDHGYIHYDVKMTLQLKGGKEYVTSRPFRIIDVTSLAPHFEDEQRPCIQFSNSLRSSRSSSLPWMRTQLPVHILPYEGDSSLIKMRLESFPDCGSDDIGLVQRIDYKVGEGNVFSKYCIVTCTRMQCDDDVRLTEFIIPKKKLPIINHCRLISVRYYMKKSPVKPDTSWLPLSWQRGPEIIITNSRSRNKEET